MHRIALACAAAIAAASMGISGASAATPTTAGPTVTAPRVTALGDSYMAGVGAGSYTVADGCRRSSRSYAADAARRTKDTLTDLSCPGARVVDVVAQATRVPASTSTAVVQVGGNDVGFSSLARSCLMPGSTTCLADIAAAKATLPGLATGLAAIASEIRARSPRAKVVFAGYPALLSTPQQCSRSALSFLLDPAEVAAIIDLQAALDSTIEDAAAQSSATYIDWPRVVDQHSLCAPSPWFVTFEPPQDALHPTAPAYSAMGRTLAALLRR